MNYGKEALKQKQQEINASGYSVYGALKVWLIKISAAILIALIVLLAVAVAGLIKGITDSAPTISSAIKTPESSATTVYYGDGSVAATLSASEDIKYVTIDNVSKYLVDAFLALEDENFFKHNGVDLSAGKNTRTITERLVENHYFTNSQKGSVIGRFVKNVQKRYVVLQLESSSSKEEILEYYLNSLTLGNGIFGVQNASLYYFGKEVADLTISEAASLAGTADAPGEYDPKDNPEKNKKRRLTALNKMLAVGSITQEQYVEAINDTDDLYLRVARQTHGTENAGKDSYFTEALLAEVKEDLMNMGYSSYEATTLIYSGGLNIYSTQDKDIQDILDTTLSDESNFPAVGEGSYYELSPDWGLSILTDDGYVFYDTSDLVDYYRLLNYVDMNNIYYHKDASRVGISTMTIDKADLEAKIASFTDAMLLVNGSATYTETNHTILCEPQVAMVITDPATGSILALYGGRGKEENNTDLNRATSLFRSPGSAMSVLACYLPALDAEGCTLASVFDDSYFSYNDDTISVYDDDAGEHVVYNRYGDSYGGLTSIRTAICKSVDIPAVRCYEMIGPNTANAYLSKLGFSHFDSASDRTVQTALGNLSGGVSIVELTSAYATLGNGGIYNAPKLYTSVYTKDGKLLLDNSENSVRVCTTETAALITDALTDVVSKGTAQDCALSLTGISLAGKDGITDTTGDLWFAGYTPYYAGGIWSGFDVNYPGMNEEDFKSLYGKVMSLIHEKKELTIGGFDRPESIEVAEVCKKCGCPAVNGLCNKNEMGNLIVSEYFAPGTLPATPCTCCREVTLCDDSGQLAGPNCPHTHTAILLDKEESVESMIHGGTADSSFTIDVLMLKGCKIHEAAE